MATTNEDPTGLNSPHLQDFYSLNAVWVILAVLFSALAALHRQTSFLDDKIKFLNLSIFAGAVVLISFVGVGISIFDSLMSGNSVNCVTNLNGSATCCETLNSCVTSYPTLPTMSSTLKTVILIIPAGHLLFLAVRMATFKPDKLHKIAGRFVYHLNEIRSTVIVALWAAYLVIQSNSSTAIQGMPYDSSLYTDNSTPGLMSTGIIGVLYLLFHSLALYTESLIRSKTLSLEGNVLTESIVGGELFFTTTMGAEPLPPSEVEDIVSQ